MGGGVLALSGRACLPSCIGLLRRAAVELGEEFGCRVEIVADKTRPFTVWRGGAFVVAGWLGVV